MCVLIYVIRLKTKQKIIKNQKKNYNFSRAVNLSAPRINKNNYGENETIYIIIENQRIQKNKNHFKRPKRKMQSLNGVSFKSERNNDIDNFEQNNGFIKYLKRKSGTIIANNIIIGDFECLIKKKEAKYVHFMLYAISSLIALRWLNLIHEKHSKYFIEIIF